MPKTRPGRYCPSSARRRGLNQCGERHANAALYRIVLGDLRWIESLATREAPCAASYWPRACSIAHAAICVRELKPSLVKIFSTWHSAVR
jgi:hypothetical protein